MNDLSKEDIADIMYCLKTRRDQLATSIRFFTETIKDGSGRRLDILENLVSGYRRDLDKIDLLILKFQNLL